jgi:hypothetical protein
MDKGPNKSWVLICVVGAFVAGILVNPAAGLPTDWRPGWEMLSAIGTIAATWVAVWVATGETRLRQHERSVKAGLVAIRLLEQLRSTHTAVLLQHGWLEALSNHEGKKASNQWLENLKATANLPMLKETFIPVSDEDLFVLSYVVPHSLSRLSDIPRQMLLINQLLEMATSYVIEGDPAAEYLEPFLENAKKEIDNLRYKINRSIDELSQHGIE